MGEIHYLSTSRDTQSRLLEQLISRTIAEHPNPVVADRWMALARRTAAKFPGPPLPSQSELDLAVTGLSDQQKQAILAEVQAYLESYFNDVRGQLMSIHGELLTLQKRVAELESSAD